MPLFSFETIFSYNNIPHFHLIGSHTLRRPALQNRDFRYINVVPCSTSMFYTLWHICDPLTILEISDVDYRRSFDNPKDLDTSTM